MPFHWSVPVAPAVRYSRRIGGRRAPDGPPRFGWGLAFLVAIPICLLGSLNIGLGVFAFSIAVSVIFSKIDRHQRARRGLPPRTLRDWMQPKPGDAPEQTRPPQAHYSNRR